MLQTGGTDGTKAQQTGRTDVLQTGGTDGTKAQQTGGTDVLQVGHQDLQDQEMTSSIAARGLWLIILGKLFTPVCVYHQSTN